MIDKFLYDVSNYVREDGCYFDGITLSFNIMPDTFYDAVVEFLKSANAKYDESERLESFNLNFKDGKAYIEVNSKQRTRLLILSRLFGIYEGMPPAKVVKGDTFEEKMFECAQKKKQQLGTSSQVLDKYSKRSQMELLEKKLDVVFGYLKFLDIEEKNSAEEITFLETKSERQASNSPKIHKQTERKNSEIKFQDRKSILDRPKYIYKINAKAANTGTEYYIKVFNVKNKCYRIVMEPKEATKYTKVVHLHINLASKSEIKKIIVDILEANREELTKKDNVTRHSHTTLAAYKSLIEYLTTMQNSGVSLGVKTSIDSATKKR